MLKKKLRKTITCVFALVTMSVLISVAGVQHKAVKIRKPFVYVRSKRFVQREEKVTRK